MTKKINLQIDSCNNCPFCQYVKQPICLYPAMVINGMPMPLDKKNLNDIDYDCPLMDSVESDNHPCPICYTRDKEGKGTILVISD